MRLALMPRQVQALPRTLLDHTTPIWPTSLTQESTQTATDQRPSGATRLMRKHRCSTGESLTPFIYCTRHSNFLKLRYLISTIPSFDKNHANIHSGVQEHVTSEMQHKFPHQSSQRTKASLRSCTTITRMTMLAVTDPLSPTRMGFPVFNFFSLYQYPKSTT